MSPAQRRRRTILIGLLLAAGITLVMAVFSGGNVVFLGLQGATDVLLGAYIYLLLQMKSRQTAAADPAPAAEPDARPAPAFARAAASLTLTRGPRARASPCAAPRATETPTRWSRTGGRLRRRRAGAVATGTLQRAPRRTRSAPSPPAAGPPGRAALAVRATHRRDLDDARGHLAAAPTSCSTAATARRRTQHPGSRSRLPPRRAEGVRRSQPDSRLRAHEPPPTPRPLHVDVPAFLNGSPRRPASCAGLCSTAARRRHPRRPDASSPSWRTPTTAATVDYPDALTGGLRRATDALRAVLERTRGDITNAVVLARFDAAISDQLRPR